MIVAVGMPWSSKNTPSCTLHVVHDPQSASASIRTSVAPTISSRSGSGAGRANVGLRRRTIAFGRARSRSNSSRRSSRCSPLAFPMSSSVMTLPSRLGGRVAVCRGTATESVGSRKSSLTPGPSWPPLRAAPSSCAEANTGRYAGRMRSVVALRLVVVLIVGLAACATAPVTVGPWQAPLGREHPLVGRVWDVRGARFVAPEAMVRALVASRFVLLGEKHDNPDNHQVQAAVLRALLASGRRPIVAFEMLTPDEAPALARYLAASPRDAAGLGPAVNWKASGWPDWAYYQPIAQAALDAGVPIV